MLVAVNSLFQIVMYSVLGWFYLTVLPGWLGLDTADLDVSMWDIAKSVLIFLGIPLARRVPHPHHRRGPQGHRLVRAHASSPASARSPSTGLLFTIVVLFALQGEQITDAPARRRPRRRPPARLLRRSCGAARSLLGYRLALPLRAQRLGRVHRRRQQLRARHRRVHRRVRRHLRPGPRRHHRPPHRGPRPRRPRLRLAVGEAALLPPNPRHRPPRSTHDLAHRHPRRRPHPDRQAVGLARLVLAPPSSAGSPSRPPSSGPACAGEQVDYVFMGHVLQAGAGQITARQAAVNGGIPMTVPGHHRQQGVPVGHQRHLPGRPTHPAPATPTSSWPAAWSR